MAVDTLATLLDAAARSCAVAAQSSWLTATNATALQLKALMFETAEEMLERVDWPECTIDQTIAGTDTDVYALASDFTRIAGDADTAVLETTPSRRSVTPVNSNVEWTNMVEAGASGAQRHYRLIGVRSIQFYRDLEAAAEVVVPYVSNKWICAADGTTTKSTFTVATDFPLIPGHLLRDGTIWRFKRDKGLAYLDRQNDYELRLARAANRSRSQGVIDMARGSMRGRMSKPTLPDTLPSA